MRAPRPQDGALVLVLVSFALVAHLAHIAGGTTLSFIVPIAGPMLCRC